MIENRNIWTSLLASIFYGVCSAFALGTGCYVYWGIRTTGHVFGSGKAVPYLSIAAAIVIGLIAGRLIQVKSYRAVVWLALIASLAFWLFVPDGWWVKWPAG